MVRTSSSENSVPVVAHFVVGALVCATPATAQSAADRELAADVDTLVRHIMSISGIPGMAIAVVKGDQPILVQGYGFADLERGIPVTEHTLFYLASTTGPAAAGTAGAVNTRDPQPASANHPSPAASNAARRSYGAEGPSSGTDE